MCNIRIDIRIANTDAENDADIRGFGYPRIRISADADTRTISTHNMKAMNASQ